MVKGKGHKRNLNNTIDTSTGLYGSSKVDKLSSTITERPSISHTTQLCNICYKKTGKGKQHKCRHSTKNVIKIIEKLPKNNQEQIVSAIMKMKVQKIEPENNRKKNIDVPLRNTHGKKITVVVVNPHEKGVLKFSAESLDNFRVNSCVSVNHVKKLANFIRCNVGKMSVPANYREHMSKKTKLFDDVYKKASHEFDCENSSVK